MWKKDELLHELHRKAARKRYLFGVISELRKQEKELAKSIEPLDAKRRSEQNDLEKVSGRGLAAFVIAASGKKDKIYEKEEREAIAAQAKYETAQRELDAVRADIKRYSGEYLSLVGYDVRYKKLLRDKALVLKEKGSPDAERIVLLIEKYAAAENEKEELGEAKVSAGRVRKAIESLLSSLSHADEWATWDIFGGGMRVDESKRENLEAAQDAVEALQIELRRFKSELGDIDMELEVSTYIEGYLRFADWFFDGIFVDYDIFRRIEEAKERIYDIRSKILAVANKISEKLAENEEETAKLKTELESLVLDAEV